MAGEGQEGGCYVREEERRNEGDGRNQIAFSCLYLPVQILSDSIIVVDPFVLQLF